MSARRIVALGAAAWLGVLSIFASGVFTGAVLHRLNELNHGGCAPTYQGDHSWTNGPRPA